jgi:hypothetical protein
VSDAVIEAQPHLLTQARFVFAKGIHAPTNGGNMLAKVQVHVLNRLRLGDLAFLDGAERRR